MDLPEMLAQPPSRPGPTRASSDGADQNQDPAFAAAVDAADAESSGNTTTADSEGAPPGAPDTKGQSDGSAGATSEEAAADSEGQVRSETRYAKVVSTGIQTELAAPQAQTPPPDQTKAQPGQPTQAAPTKAVVAEADVTPPPQQPAKEGAAMQVKTPEVAESDSKTPQPAKPEASPQMATAVRPARQDSKPASVEASPEADESAALTRSAPKVEQPQQAQPAPQLRPSDASPKRARTEPTVAEDADFRVTVRSSGPKDGAAQPVVKTENGSGALTSVQPEAPRNTQRTRASFEPAPRPRLEADAPVEAPKPSPELKIAPELPSPGRTTEAQATPRGTSLVTPVPTFSMTPAQGPQLQTAPMPAAAIADQIPGFVEARIGPQLTAAAGTRSNGGVVEVMLEPPELGRVEIQMELSDQGLRATLSAERQATTDLLRRNLELLAQQFEDAGFADVDLDFASFGDGELAFEQDDEDAGNQGPETDTPASQTRGAGTIRPSTHHGVVDIRL